MKKRSSKIHLPGHINKELGEDLRLLQHKIRGGMSVYKNRVMTYRRRPKHRKQLSYTYEFDPHCETDQALRQQRGLI